MNDRASVLVSDEGGRRRRIGSFPPSSPAGLAPLLMAAGLVLALAGWVDVGLFYYPQRFGDGGWEFGTVAQTFDAMPLATVGLVLLALGVRARGGSVAWTRGVALILAVVAVLCVAALVLFALDIPLALRALKGPGAQASPQKALMSHGLKRGIAKVILFGVGYALAYWWMAITMWRVPREAAHGTRDPA